MAASVDESWLGIADVVTEGQFIGADGCGIVPSDDPAWAGGQPNDWNNQDLAVLVPKNYGPTWSLGWHDVGSHNTMLPLCQLPLCYQSACP